jgi:hypothetical protein
MKESVYIYLFILDIIIINQTQNENIAINSS